MSQTQSAQITLPVLTDDQAYHLVDTLYDILLIVDNHYVDQIHRHIDWRNNYNRPCSRCQLKTNRAADYNSDDAIPF